MELYTLKILLFKILLFNRNLVFCQDIDNLPQANNNTPNVYNYTNLITSNLSYSSSLLDDVTIIKFAYELPNAHSGLLSHPNQLDKINIGEYILKFDENVKLPSLNVNFISMYTCIHNNPVLIVMESNSVYYYYSLNHRSNKWNNHRIKNASGLTEYVDQNGVYFYKTSNGGSNIPNYTLEAKQLINVYCAHGDSTNNSVVRHKNIQIYTRNNSVFNPQNKPKPKPQQKIFSTQQSPSFPAIVNKPVSTVNDITESTNLYFYKIDKSMRQKLIYPNKIDKILFNNYVIQFENDTILPPDNVDYVYIYTCKHNNPILMYMQCNVKNYYYSLIAKTNKWTNHRVQYDNLLYQYVDQNSIPYYIIPPGYYSPSPTHKYEDKELVKRLCKREKCFKLDVNKNRNIEIYTRNNSVFNPQNQSKPKPQQKPKPIKYSTQQSPSKPNPSSPKAITYPTQEISKAIQTNVYDYQVSDTMRLKLFYPNKIDKILFNNYTFVFDENVKLPSFYVDNIYIYTCIHNSPILMYMQCKSIYFFYSLDSKSNKWTNHRIKYDTGLKEFIDINGTYYYTISRSILDDSVIEKFEDKEIAKAICKEGKCTKYNVNRNKNIQIFISTPKTPQVTNTGSPKKTQVTRNGNVNTTKPFPSNNTNKTPVIGSSAHISDSLPTKRFDYDIDVTSRSRLRYPNNLDRINFNDYIIQFEENAKLPVAIIDHVFIYTCVHNNPFLLLMYGDSKFYYYSMDSKSNKWINHTIKYDERFTRYIDPNGAYYYIISPSNSSTPTSRKYEDKELVKLMCKREKCVKLDVSKDKNIEIFTK